MIAHNHNAVTGCPGREGRKPDACTIRCAALLLKAIKPLSKRARALHDPSDPAVSTADPMARRILLLFAHPRIRHSRVNAALLTAARSIDGLTVHDLYETYPDFTIDQDHEQTLLAEHDALVIQHPFYWYSSPSIVKEWLDLVLEHGWAYGRTGTALSGKLWMQAVTTGGRVEAYGEGGINRWSVEDLLRPFEACANLCRMEWQRPFVSHAAHLAGPAEIEAAATAYRARLLQMRDGSALRAVV